MPALLAIGLLVLGAPPAGPGAAPPREVSSEVSDFAPPEAREPDTVRVHRELTIAGATDATNDRFTGSPSFVAGGFDLSGIGQDDLGRMATAISRNVVLSADHFHPDSTLFFFPGNDATEPPVERQLVAGAQIGDTDLFVAVLDADLPSSIRHYAYATEPLSGTPGYPVPVASAGSYDDLNAYIVGRSPKNNPAHQDQAVGRNRVTGYLENVPVLLLSDADSLIFRLDDSEDADFVTYEAQLDGGDSGGPTFVEIEGDLLLLGTNAFIYGDGDVTISGPGSGISYTGNQASAIAAYVASNVTSANLAIGLEAPAEPVVAGEVAALTVTVTNDGPDPSVEVEITTTLPVGVTAVSTTGCDNDADGLPTCTLAELEVGVPVAVTLLVQLAADAVGELAIEVSVASVVTADPSDLDDTASATITAIPAGIFDDDFEDGLGAWSLVEPPPPPLP